MRRTYNVHGGGLPDLVLDIPLYSASMEHLADQCGHETCFFKGTGDNGLETATAAPGVTGIRLLGNYGMLPYWRFEPIDDAHYTYSFFCSDIKARGHGWIWEFWDERGISSTIVACACSYGGLPIWRAECCSFWYGANADRPWWYPESDTLSIPDFLLTPRFMTVVVDEALCRLYIDGVLVEQATDSKLLAPVGSVGVRWQAGDGGNSADAVFRQFKLFRKSLSADEVAALYAHEVAVFNAAAAATI